MKKLLMISALFGISGCVALPPVPTPPATPVFFQPFSAALDPSALSAIASVAKAAGEEPGARVVVTGCADSVGSTQANRYLSETRAQMVVDALVGDGVAPSRIRPIRVAQARKDTGKPAQGARRVLIQLAGG
jgi:outer membrane protein OmpA-like peptidoglycan-associated protein